MSFCLSSMALKSAMVRERVAAGGSVSGGGRAGAADPSLSMSWWYGQDNWVHRMGINTHLNGVGVTILTLMISLITAREHTGIMRLWPYIKQCQKDA
jgi:hypothetical protein